MFKFAKLSDQAFNPTRSSEESAGYDLYSAYDDIVPARSQCLVKTDIQFSLPKGCYGRIAPRSGLALEHFIDVGAGVIDRDYRGNICIVIFNLGKRDFYIKRGDRVAQIILEQIFNLEIEESKIIDISPSTRGTDGFGSTGII